TTVSVEARGDAKLRLNGDVVTLRRFSIDGVAWGREILYLDQTSRFAASVTRANLLPLEGVREDLAAAHPELLDAILADAADEEIALAKANTHVEPVAAGDFALVGARIVDGSARAPIANGTVLIRAGRIAAVGSSQDVKVPAGMR